MNEFAINLLIANIRFCVEPDSHQRKPEITHSWRITTHAPNWIDIVEKRHRIDLTPMGYATSLEDALKDGNTAVQKLIAQLRDLQHET